MAHSDVTLRTNSRHLVKRRPAGQRPQGNGFLARKALGRRLLRPAVPLNVSHLAHPMPQVRFQRRPAREAVARNVVVLDIANASLVLALGARPIRRIGAGADIPVAAERGEPRVETHLPPNPTESQTTGVI